MGGCLSKPPLGGGSTGNISTRGTHEGIDISFGGERCVGGGDFRVHESPVENPGSGSGSVSGGRNNGGVSTSGEYEGIRDDGRVGAGRGGGGEICGKGARGGVAEATVDIIDKRDSSQFYSMMEDVSVRSVRSVQSVEEVAQESDTVADVGAESWSEKEGDVLFQTDGGKVCLCDDVLGCDVLLEVNEIEIEIDTDNDDEKQCQLTIYELGSVSLKEMRLNIVSRYRPLGCEDSDGRVDDQVEGPGPENHRSRFRLPGDVTRSRDGVDCSGCVGETSMGDTLAETKDAFACTGYLQLKVRNKEVTSTGKAETETLTVKTTHVAMSRVLPVCERYESMMKMLSKTLMCDLLEVKLVPDEMQWHVGVAEQLGTLPVDRKLLDECFAQAKEEVVRGEKLCPLNMLGSDDDVMVVPDMQQDVRYKDHPCVTGAPHVRFFAAAWLKGMDESGGSRRRRRSSDSRESNEDWRKYGILYLADKEPRDPGYVKDIEGIIREAAKVVTMAIDEYKLDAIKALLVTDRKRRKSEDALAKQKDSVQRADLPGGDVDDENQKMLRLSDGISDDWDDGVGRMVSAVDCFQDGCMLLECIVGTKFAVGWNIIHVNDSLGRQLECDGHSMVGHGFWEYFMTDITERSFTNSLVRQNRPFELGATFQNVLHPKPTGVMLEFRPTAAVGSSGNVTPREMETSSPASSQPRADMSTFFSANSNASTQAPERGSVSRASQISSVTEAILGARSSSSTISYDGAGSEKRAGGDAKVMSRRRGSGRSLLGEPNESGYSLRDAGRRSSGEVKRYYFAHLRADAVGAIGVRGPTLQLSKEAPRVFKDIRLGPLIGRGAYGRVYRGNWNGNIVAVKVITSEQKLAESQLMEGASAPNRSNAKGLHEAVLSSALSHPNVLHTYQYSFRHVPAAASNRSRSQDGKRLVAKGNNHMEPKGSSPEGTSDDPDKLISELWLVSEFCNRGPLLTAIESGLFMIHAANAKPASGVDPGAAGSQTNLIYILQTAQEISAAMEYLHGHDVVHGDLTGGNVLLQSSDKDGRGFTAKVVDFGLSRVCSGGSLKTSKMGCAEYMPPELITRGLLTKAGDVYAFGVILWELYMGKRAWAGVQPSEVLSLVSKGTTLQYPEHTPRRLKILGERCLSVSMDERPQFADVVHEVNTILADTMAILRNFLGISGS